MSSSASKEEYIPEEYEDGPAPIVRIQSLKPDGPTYALLRDVKVEKFVRKDHKMVIFKSSDSIETAVKTLSDNKLLSAPVFDGSQCLGFCDIRDIMQFIIHSITSDGDVAAKLKSASKEISSTTLEKVVNFSSQNPYIPVFESAELSQAAQFLRRKHVHRAVILNERAEITGILSQSDIIKYVARHLDGSDALKDLGRQSLSSLKEKRDGELKKDEGEGKLESIASDETAVAALTAMRLKGLSVVAVVDKHGKLVGEFSCSDLRGITNDNFARLLSTVEEYLKTCSKDGLTPHTIKIDATLQDLLSLINEKHCHHVWVVDSHGKPSSLISLTDIMMFITN